jgi:adenylate cyclase
MSVEGLGAEKAGAAFRRARELFQKLSIRARSVKKSLLFQSLYGLWSYHWVRAEYIEAGRLAEQLVALAKTAKDPHMRSQSHYALGIILMDHGEYASALAHLQQGSSVICRCCAEVARWHVGYPDQALKNIEDILAHAMKTRNAENVIFAHMGTARVNTARGEYRKALDRSQTAINTARNMEMDELWLIPMRVVNGWATAKLGKRSRGILQMRRALSILPNVEVSNLKPLLSALFAEGLLDSGQFEEGLAVVDEALDISNQTAMHHYDAELHRLKGELLLRRQAAEGDIRSSKIPKVREAENCFKRAEATAQRQQVKSLELRAATSLARLLLQRNRRAEAHRHLTKIYGWFNEGHDTADLKSARQLLEELAE